MENARKYLDYEGLKYYNNILQHQLDNKIDKVEGKGLSTNDYTDIDKSKLNKFSDADNYALKSDIVNIYKFKGSVTSYEDLPTSRNIVGDVYNTEDTGMNYAWVGDNTWDALGGTISFEYITNSDIDIMFE